VFFLLFLIITFFSYAEDDNKWGNGEERREINVVDIIDGQKERGFFKQYISMQCP